MKNFLSIFALTAVSAAALLPLAASAQTRVQVTINDHAPVRAYERYDERDHPISQRQYQYQYQPTYAYAPSAWSARDRRYVEPRRWIDRNHDGMDDRRGRRDLDRDGIMDRYDRDLDNDGIANRYDRDMDGDGVSNRRDRRPDNRYAY
jgi:hypothetical protein